MKLISSSLLCLQINEYNLMLNMHLQVFTHIVIVYIFFINTILKYIVNFMCVKIITKIQSLTCVYMYTFYPVMFYLF